MNKVLSKVDEIIDKLKVDDKIIRIFNLKDNIDNDLEIQSLLNDYNENKEKNISVQDLKIKLYNNPKIKEYLSIQNEFDYGIMCFNNRLSQLLDNKECR